MTEYILQLLARIDPKVLMSSSSCYPREIVASQSALIKRKYFQGTVAYQLPQKRVNLLSYEECRKSTDEYAQTTPVNYDYNDHSLFSSVSWITLLYFLISSQEFLFTSYDQALSALSKASVRYPRSKIKMLKVLTDQVIIDFEEYYDVDVTSKDSPYFKTDYEALKEINLVDKHYSILLDKRNLLSSQAAEEQRKNQQFALIVAIASIIVASAIQILKSIL
jgi:hypothetical protein